MKRQIRRQIKRSWDKISCFSYCADGITIDELPNTAVDVYVKVSPDLMLQYNLDMFQRWRLYPVVAVDGFFLRGLYYIVGVASDNWLDQYFEHDDLDFEGNNDWDASEYRKNEERRTPRVYYCSKTKVMCTVRPNSEGCLDCDF